jgi:hypothetical protein
MAHVVEDATSFRGDLGGIDMALWWRASMANVRREAARHMEYPGSRSGRTGADSRQEAGYGSPSRRKVVLLTGRAPGSLRRGRRRRDGGACDQRIVSLTFELSGKFWISIVPGNHFLPTSTWSESVRSFTRLFRVFA